MKKSRFSNYKFRFFTRRLLDGTSRQLTSSQICGNFSVVSIQLVVVGTNHFEEKRSQRGSRIEAFENRSNFMETQPLRPGSLLKLQMIQENKFCLVISKNQILLIQGSRSGIQQAVLGTFRFKFSSKSKRSIFQEDHASETTNRFSNGNFSKK